MVRLRDATDTEVAAFRRWSLHDLPVFLASHDTGWEAMAKIRASWHVGKVVGNHGEFWDEATWTAVALESGLSSAQLEERACSPDLGPVRGHDHDFAPAGNPIDPGAVADLCRALTARAGSAQVLAAFWTGHGWFPTHLRGRRSQLVTEFMDYVVVGADRAEFLSEWARSAQGYGHPGVFGEPQGVVDSEGTWSLWMDVDLPWSLIAGDSGLIERLARMPGLEVEVVPRG